MNECHVTAGGALSNARFIRYDRATAGISSGEIARFSGPDSIAAVLSLESPGPLGPDSMTFLPNCGGRPVGSEALRGGTTEGAIKLRERTEQLRTICGCVRPKRQFLDIGANDHEKIYHDEKSDDEVSEDGSSP